MAHRKAKAERSSTWPKLGTFLEPELLEKVKAEAEKRGESASTFAHNLLANAVKFKQRNGVKRK